MQLPGQLLVRSVNMRGGMFARSMVYSTPQLPLKRTALTSASGIHSELTLLT